MGHVLSAKADKARADCCEGGGGTSSQRERPMKKPKKVRVDELLLSRSVVASKGEAQALVLAGDVMVGEIGRSCDKQVTEE